MSHIEERKNNVVAQNSIFRETLAKERKAFRLREDFMLNPAKMNTLPPKPCLVVNGEMPPDISKKHGLEVKDFDPSVKEELEATLLEKTKVPTEKYLQPVTTAQEIGWMHLEYGNQFKNRKAYGIKNNAITKFAEAYVIDMGMNPFQKKPGAGGGGGGAAKE